MAENDINENIKNPGWISVISLFLINFYIFGIIFTWGIFQKLYLYEIYSKDFNVFQLSFVGTTSCSFVVSFGIIVSFIVKKINYKKTMLIGTFLSSISLILASFSKKYWEIYLTQGLLFGIGGSLVFCSSVSLPQQWFNKKKGLAIGISSCGSGIGGLVLSPLTHIMINNIGYRNTLRILGLIGFLILLISTLILKIRFPLNKNPKIILFDKTFLNSHIIILFIFGIVISFVYFSPFIFITIYAHEIDFNSTLISIFIGIMIGLNSLGRVITGYISDKIGNLNTMIICTIMSGLSNLILCINNNKHIIFIIYIIFYGITGNNIFSLIPIYLSNIFNNEKLLQIINICYMSLFIGTLIGSPILGIIYDIYGLFVVYMIIGSFTIFSSFIIIFLKIIKTNNIFEKC